MSAFARFKAWIADEESKGSTRAQVAEKIGLSESALSRILSGDRGVGGRNAARIERATAALEGGPIRAADWYPEVA